MIVYMIRNSDRKYFKPYNYSSSNNKKWVDFVEGKIYARKGDAIKVLYRYPECTICEFELKYLQDIDTKAEVQDFLNRKKLDEQKSIEKYRYEQSKILEKEIEEKKRLLESLQ